ncbi:beta-galactosidase [Paenibacillus sp. WQ 127069]|uniref:beta-galactosidase n=1 Tax=Paenibacillus baimaensis TaxID=2982185 RepID=A0ABT2URW1_9BACL|nr:beta-galactosidase [Paenibacillus sp. WQ 127069]MCU6796542.1 beta-galactosidase [Paenibacillus sp. WQ 127069]
MAGQSKPQVAYGAVYFRKSNPPGQDWERDYAQAAKDGMNIFRHWFMWGNIEVAPGVYDWEDYDRHMDLASQYGIRTIIAEMISFIPQWMYRTHSHLLEINADGSKVHGEMNGSSATGGSSGGSGGALCLDFAEAKEHAGRFLRELVTRYKDHPGMYGYDVWNECNYSPNIGYSSATQAKFREWLELKYGSLKKLNKAWNRYTYASWEDVQAPKQIAQFPECMDWLQFKKENFHNHMQWRIDLIRSLDNDNLITAHGIAASLESMASGGSDDWLAASKVESYGMTWVTARKGSEPWKQAHAIDLLRASSRRKPFWHAEMQGGPLWLQPQVIGRAKEDGRVAAPEDVRLWNLTSLAGGARGVLYLRWRSLLDGPLFGAFGLYDMNGLPNPRSEMARTIAQWSNAPEQASLMSTQPIQADIGIVVVPETQVFNHLLQQAGEGKYYTKCMYGAYRGFFDNHIQADWVHIDHIDEYSALYLPYPIMLTAEQAGQLADWVKRGGTLISEGCPAYFGDRGTVGVIQPNHGLDQVFGAVQHEVEFMPDITHTLRFNWGGGEIGGGLFRQSYKPLTGKVCGTYTDGSAAVIEHRYGDGKVLLIGTFPSEAYQRTEDPGTRSFFRNVLAWAGIKPQVTVSSGHLQVRLQSGDAGKYAWIINPHHEPVSSFIQISEAFGPVAVKSVMWGEFSGSVTNGQFEITVPAKDAVILEL